MRVLAIDDDPSVLLSIRRQVQKAGFEVEVAVGGEEGLKRLAAGPFDIVVCDWMMPDVDGLEICRQIRSDEGRPYTYILMLTSRDTPDDILLGVEAGADDYMTKPVHESEVRARLTSAGRIVKLERDLAAHVEALTKAMDEVKTLQGLLPIWHVLPQHPGHGERLGAYRGVPGVSHGHRVHALDLSRLLRRACAAHARPLRKQEAAKREEGQDPGRATGT